jgi:hypothetical protein
MRCSLTLTKHEQATIDAARRQATIQWDGKFNAATTQWAIDYCWNRGLSARIGSHMILLAKRAYIGGYMTGIIAGLMSSIQRGEAK